MNMEYKEIKELIKEMESSNLSILSLELPDGLKINIEKQNNGRPILIDEKVPEPLPQKEENKIQDELKIIKAPMVGTFYASNNPNKPPYVKSGDTITKGQVVCIVEAMKLMNEIESEFDGEIVEVCVKDGETVGYGEPLFKIK